MKRNYITLSLLLGVALSMTARERTVAEMKQGCTRCDRKERGGQKKSAPLNAEALQVLDQKSQLTVLGTQGGGFAVIANDDNFSPVLGYSENFGQWRSGSRIPLVDERDECKSRTGSCQRRDKRAGEARRFLQERSSTVAYYYLGTRANRTTTSPRYIRVRTATNTTL